MKVRLRALVQEWRLRREFPALLGLDLGSTSVRLVELGSTRNTVVLEHLAREPLERGWVSEGQIEQFDAVAEAVRRAVHRSGTRTRRVAMALPASAVVTQKLRLPAGLPEEALAQQVAAEAHQQLPFALDEVSLDFCVTGAAPQDDEVEVLVVASRRDRVQDRQGLAEAAGLEPVVLDVESHAARRAVARLVQAPPLREGRAPAALFEIGADATVLTLLGAQEPLYERELPVGGAQLTRLIAQRLDLGFDAAEHTKLAAQPEAEVAALQAAFVEEVAQGLARALEVCFASTPHHEVSGVLLAGGTAALPGLQPRVAQLTGFEARVVDPFEGLALGPALHAPRLPREAPAYLKACGLALRRFQP